MKTVCWISLLVSALGAPGFAQPPHSIRTSSALSVIGTPPEELAESVVIFVPAVDTPFVTAEHDVYLKGRITHTERGETPGAIVMPAHRFTSSHPAGVPVRLYLMRHPEQDAYYSIAGGVVDATTADAAREAALATAAATLSVQTYSPLGHAVNKADLHRVPYGFGVTLRMDGNSDARADLYFGVLRPDGLAYTWTNANGAAQIAVGMKPLREDISLASSGLFHSRDLFGRDIEFSFDGTEAAGMYQVFALLVEAGANPADTATWVAEDFSVLFVE